jgi:hypothetical protein
MLDLGRWRDLAVEVVRCERVLTCTDLIRE